MRNIEKKMVDYLDARLAGNGLAQEAMKKKDPRTVFALAAQACVGIREVGGNNKGPMVELLQETIGSASAEAWCMSFVQTCLAYAEKKTGIKSPVFASEHCLTVWQKTPKTARVKKVPARGAIAIWNYPPGVSGHTGIVDVFTAKKMNLFEGNTEKGLTLSGAIERDGGGCYYTERSTGSTKKMKLLGFIKPF
jgi:hypothetical protein